MSAPIETVPTPDSAATVVPPAPEQQPSSSETADWQAKYKEMQKHAAEWQKRSEQNLKQLKEFEERDLTELQRAQKQAQEATERAAQLERTSLQQQVALEKGIPADLVGFLSGATVEELTAHADRLLAWRGTPTPSPVPQPQPDLSQGPRPIDPAAATDAEFAAHEAFLFPNNRR